METDLADRLRAICLALPEVTERPSHGAPTWFVRDKKSFVTLWADGHHDNRFAHLWCAGLPGSQTTLIAADPDRFFRPPYVGGRGWIGVRLDARSRSTGMRSPRYAKTPIERSPSRPHRPALTASGSSCRASRRRRGRAGGPG